MSFLFGRPAMSPKMRIIKCVKRRQRKTEQMFANHVGVWYTSYAVNFCLMIVKLYSDTAL